MVSVMTRIRIAVRDYDDGTEDLRSLLRDVLKELKRRKKAARRAREQASVAADQAVRELLFLAAIEGMKCLSRGGKGCVFRAVEILRPDIAAEWAAAEDGNGDVLAVLEKHFPEGG